MSPTRPPTGSPTSIADASPYNTSMKTVLHWLPHLLLAPLLCPTVITLAHEAAHAVMALALGGVVTEMSFLPSGAHLGHIRYEGLSNPIARELVSGAPYLMWTAMALGTAVFAAAQGRVKAGVAWTLFVWGYVVPLGDIAMGAAVGSDLETGSDLDRLLMLTMLTVPYAAGWFVQKRLLGDDALRPVAYVLGSVLFVGLFGIAAQVGISGAMALTP